MKPEIFEFEKYSELHKFLQKNGIEISITQMKRDIKEGGKDIVLTPECRIQYFKEDKLTCQIWRTGT